MRDGVVLRADVYRPPTDATAPGGAEPHALRPQLSPDPARRPRPRARGRRGPRARVPGRARPVLAPAASSIRFASEETDGFDSVEWVAAQPWCDGKVAMAGRSYGAATQWLAAAARPPHLVAIFPVVTGSDSYDGWIYQGGAFQLGFNLFWLQLMTAPQAAGLAGRAVPPPARSPTRRCSRPAPRVASTATGWRIPTTTPTGSRSRSTAATGGSRCRPTTSAAGTTCSSPARSRTTVACVTRRRRNGRARRRGC